MVEKPRADLLTLSTAFYDVSVSCNRFLEGKKRLFGASGTRKLMNKCLNIFFQGDQRYSQSVDAVYIKTSCLEKLADFQGFMKTEPKWNSRYFVLEDDIFKSGFPILVSYLKWDESIPPYDMVHIGNPGSSGTTTMKNWGR